MFAIAFENCIARDAKPTDEFAHLHDYDIAQHLSTMAASIDPRRVAIVYNGSLPGSLGGLGEYVASQVADYNQSLNLVLLDLSSFLLPHSSDTEQHLTDKPVAEAASKYDQQAFQNVMCRYSGYFFVFPGHVWSHTHLIKQMVSQLPRHVYANKPTAVVTYTREDTRPWYQNQANESCEHVPRSSAPMMAEFLSQLAGPEDAEPDSLLHSRSTGRSPRAGRRRGFNMVQMPQYHDGQPMAWPEFSFFWDIWDDFPSTNAVWPGGNQIEAWEASGWGKCITIATMMKKTFDTSRP